MNSTGEAEQLEVHLNSPDFGGDAVVGQLRRLRGGSGALVSFGFDPEWLSRGQPLVLDPELGQFEGDQYPRDRQLFGIFSDIAPDRWGRTLLQRREAARARKDRRRVRALDEWDYVVQVSDASRMGALRIKVHGGQSFLSDDPHPIPPVARLRQLEHIARQVEMGEPLSSNEEEEEIAMLVAPGSSLGGARPKATFQDVDGTFWMAKFPSQSDTWDVAAWEFVLSRLATAAGITCPPTKILKLAAHQRTFLTQRFDRTEGGRHLFASAMTLCDAGDHDNASYLDIAQSITQFGDPSSINADLQQLFRRVLFNVATGNRDDHLRNHGFLGVARGWRLSPSFDMNPMPANSQHAIAIDAFERVPDISLAMSTARAYRVNPATANRILDEVRAAVGSWRSVAREINISGSEIELMANAFVW